MNEYFRLLEAAGPHLMRKGLSKEAEELMPRCFGSAIATFSDGETRLRLGWDGKDRAYLLQSMAMKPPTRAGLDEEWLDLRDQVEGRGPFDQPSPMIRDLGAAVEILSVWLSRRDQGRVDHK